MTLSQTLFSFKGRINRAKYWIIHLVIAAVGVIFVIYFSNNPVVVDNAIVSALVFSYVIFAAWVGLAVNVKRWHDLDKSGWLELIHVAAFFELGFREGTPGPNRFGPDPLG
jgi:uncharacterized membrane protein YhaH (DUF805 family)